MKKMIALILALAMLAACAAATAEGSGEKKVPSFLTPSVFLSNFNALMEALADEYAGDLTEQAVLALKNYYTFRLKDEQGTIVYYGMNDWEVEAAFYFPDGAPDDNLPSKLMNINIRNDTPALVVTFTKFILAEMIAYEYQDIISREDVLSWFETAEESGGTFSLPGYTLGVLVADEHMQYLILPAEESGSAELSGATFETLTGLKEAQETLAAGRKFSCVYYSEGAGFAADVIEVTDQKGMSTLWGAVNALQIGEQTDAPTGGTAQLSFWFNNDTSFILDFAGRTLRTADGKYYTLKNDEALRNAIGELTDRYRLTIRIEGFAYILGESTPQDMIDHKWGHYSIEQDGTIGFSDAEGNHWLYVSTEHGRLDEPILTVNAFWSEMYIEYCGFDGIFSIGQLDDPDAVWSTDGYTVDERDNLIEDGEMSSRNHWEGLGRWLAERFGAAESDEGIIEAKIQLNDGRTVYVATNGTPVRLSLLPD